MSGKKPIEEIIIKEIGETIRHQSSADAGYDSIMKILRKHDGWLRQIAVRIQEQQKILQQLMGKKKITVAPKVTPDAKGKILKCNGCGIILHYALDGMCPVCGGKDISKAA